jgi:thiazole/oxazole-forming peptide maturase SagD family component
MIISTDHVVKDVIDGARRLRLSIVRHNGHMMPRTADLMPRMLSPLCGFDQRVSVMLRNRSDPRFITVGAELCGVHVLRDQPAPPVGVYHIGGSGVFRDEALIKTLAETAERYAQMVSQVSGKHRLLFATYAEIVAEGKRVLSFEKLQYFSSRQLASSAFPFRAAAKDRPFSWAKTRSLFDNSELWIPAQLLLVGYTLRKADGEDLCIPAVTTGTAAHVTATDALRNALLELVQTDCAMGHWYSSHSAPKIDLDRRTRAIGRVLERQFPLRGPEPAFHWLRNADLPAFTIACTLHSSGDAIPTFAVGLGCDMKLVPAMYKALVEAVAVRQLAKITLLDRSVGERSGNGPIDPDNILDLDNNVAYYAMGAQAALLKSKFAKASLAASDLPPDWEGDARDAIRILVRGFAETGKELVFLDLTTEDVRQLGLSVIRAWSPDILSLSLPSCPPEVHPRFAAYGGFKNQAPHPYP